MASSSSSSRSEGATGATNGGFMLWLLVCACYMRFSRLVVERVVGCVCTLWCPCSGSRARFRGGCTSVEKRESYRCCTAKSPMLVCNMVTNSRSMQLYGLPFTTLTRSIQILCSLLTQTLCCCCCGLPASVWCTRLTGLRRQVRPADQRQV